jgi:ADP-heptose:LPS heptosyltransferase
VIIASSKRHLAILRSCAGLDLSRVEFCDDEKPLPAFDFYVALLTLPHIFKTDLGSIPADVPYLAAQEERVAKWREKLGGGDAFRVGINWQGNPKNPHERQRAIPLSQFAPLAKIEGVRLYSLQKETGLDQLAEAKFVVDLGDELDRDATMVDTAAVIKNLDLVISSDTSVVHMAGALAAPTWVAIPFAPDWRWLLDRTDSPWYPTMRLFRQSRAGDWPGVFERIAGELAKVVKGKG